MKNDLRTRLWLFWALADPSTRMGVYIVANFSFLLLCALLVLWFPWLLRLFAFAAALAPLFMLYTLYLIKNRK